ncbi:putative quinol monooxygenase [Phytoactinopolyspora endophytica]|uniref:putative quinol monooxygenase n=1 Tax=Phytoactinopolyspora endophytica TaxID=1642495 RepID=UPI001F0D1F1C|nr:putative quinol monooxygenase [Phytoactinopolyspora endophytica]
MYHIAVSFTVPDERREEFIAAALEDGRNSAADEPGTRRFELICDADDPNRFYLNEAYDNEAAFNAHAEGPHFARFFSLIEGFADGPGWLIKGTRIEDPRVIAPVALIASFRAKPGQESRLREELEAMVEPSLAEDGCLEYRPYVDPAHPDAMVIIETWASSEALKEHFATPHFKGVAAVLDDILAEPFTLHYLNVDSEA